MHGEPKTRLNKPARGGAGFVFIPVFKIAAAKHVGGPVRERPWRGGSCRRLGLSRSFRWLMVSRPRVTFSIGIDNAEVMLRMLGVVFRSDAVPGRLGVAGQRQIFFKQLVGIAANPPLRSIAVEGLMS